MTNEPRDLLGPGDLQVLDEDGNPILDDNGDPVTPIEDLQPPGR